MLIQFVYQINTYFICFSPTFINKLILNPTDKINFEIMIGHTLNRNDGGLVFEERNKNKYILLKKKQQQKTKNKC